MSDGLKVTTKLPPPRPINLFLLENRILIKDNPAISPDLSLDCPGLVRELRYESALLAALPDGKAAAAAAHGVTVYPASELTIDGDKAFFVESRRTGDSALLIRGNKPLGFDTIDAIDGVRILPLTWENLVTLKNVLTAQDPGSTVFPRPDGQPPHPLMLAAAPFTSLHWPALAWTMKHLGLSLVISHGSIPGELTQDLTAMLTHSSRGIECPSLGGTVPEGHQGQSTQGTSVAALAACLKLGFHRNRIPWGLCHHHPVGGHFDELEDALIEGGLLASHVVYDPSPELSLRSPLTDQADIEAAFRTSIDAKVHAAVAGRLSSLGLAIETNQLMRLETHLWPAMQKIARSDAATVHNREQTFSAPAARRYLRGLAIDELAETNPIATAAVFFALAEAMGVPFSFVVPGRGWHFRAPTAPAPEAVERMRNLADVAQRFGVACAYRTAEQATALPDQTSAGRAMYAMGTVLAASTDPADRKLWRDWYTFTQKVVSDSAFAGSEVQRNIARGLITYSLQTAGKPTAGIFDSPDRLARALNGLPPSPDHAFWLEYGFLFILAAECSPKRLVEQSQAGFEQRARFYRISDQGRLLFARQVAYQIRLIGEAAGFCPQDRIDLARKQLEAYRTHAELLADIP